MRQLQAPRAWDDVANKMLYAIGIEQFDDMLGFRFDHFETENPTYLWPTGLTDRNGKEIYEGDIVSFKDAWDGADTSLPEKVGVVGYSDASFRIERATISHYRWMDYDIEVLGNRFEHPHLIE